MSRFLLVLLYLAAFFLDKLESASVAFTFEAPDVINQGDRINIGLAETVGVNVIGVTYPGGRNCTLKREVVEKPTRVCRNVTVPVCKTVQKIRLRNITENCEQHAEYCQYTFRTMETIKQTILCSRSAEMDCVGSCADCGEECIQNKIVTCSTIPQVVAVTEKKQRCGSENVLQTTKICFTYPDGSWLCREQNEPRECDRSSVRLVAHEETQPKIECEQSEGAPLCIPTNCRLRSNETDCISTDFPTQFEVKDEICEPCQHGRTKLRTILEQEEECEDGNIEEVCTQMSKREYAWMKYCHLPHQKHSLDHQGAIISENSSDVHETGAKRTPQPPTQVLGTRKVEEANIYFANKLFRQSTETAPGSPGQSTERTPGSPGQSTERAPGSPGQSTERAPGSPGQSTENTLETKRTYSDERFSSRPTPFPRTTPRFVQDQSTVEPLEATTTSTLAQTATVTTTLTSTEPSRRLPKESKSTQEGATASTSSRDDFDIQLFDYDFQNFRLPELDISDESGSGSFLDIRLDSKAPERATSNFSDFPDRVIVSGEADLPPTTTTTRNSFSSDNGSLLDRAGTRSPNGSTGTQNVSANSSIGTQSAYIYSSKETQNVSANSSKETQNVSTNSSAGSQYSSTISSTGTPNVYTNSSTGTHTQSTHSSTGNQNTSTNRSSKNQNTSTNRNTGTQRPDNQANKTQNFVSKLHQHLHHDENEIDIRPVENTSNDGIENVKNAERTVNVKEPPINNLLDLTPTATILNTESNNSKNVENVGLTVDDAEKEADIITDSLENNNIGNPPNDNSLPTNGRKNNKENSGTHSKKMADSKMANSRQGCQLILDLKARARCRLDKCFHDVADCFL